MYASDEPSPTLTLITGTSGESTDFSKVTATSNDVLTSKTFYNSNGKLVSGNITVYNEWNSKPSTVHIDIPEGYHKGSWIEGDIHLQPEFIRHNVDLFGVVGSFTGDATATAADIKSGKTAGIKGELVSGTLDLTNLTADNIKAGITINGITGTFEGESSGSTSLGAKDLVLSNARYAKDTDDEPNYVSDPNLSNFIEGVWRHKSSDGQNNTWEKESDPSITMEEEYVELNAEEGTPWNVYIYKNGDNIAESSYNRNSILDGTFSVDYDTGSFIAWIKADVSIGSASDSSGGSSNSGSSSGIGHTDNITAPSDDNSKVILLIGSQSASYNDPKGLHLYKWDAVNRDWRCKDINQNYPLVLASLDAMYGDGREGFIVFDENNDLLTVFTATGGSTPWECTWVAEEGSYEDIICIAWSIK